MNLNEAIVEDSALVWFGELGYAVGHGTHIALGNPTAKRDSVGKGVMVVCLREAEACHRPIPHPRHSARRALPKPRIGQIRVDPSAGYTPVSEC